MFTLHLHRNPGTRPPITRAGGRRVQEWRDQGDAPCAYGYAGTGWWAMEWPDWATFRFGPALGSTVEVTHEPGVEPRRIEDTYRRSVLPLQLQALGYETLHASAVSIDGGTVAFCGERQAGKSTLAFAVHRRGFRHRADDTVVLTVKHGVVTTVPLPFTPRLRPASAEFFDAPPLSIQSVEDRPEPLRAVFILSRDVGAAPCVVDRLAGGAAFAGLLAHAHCFEPADPEPRRRLVQNYLEISAAVPVFSLRYAPCLADLPLVVDRVLAEAGAGQPVP
jgi:hypothetical protein